MDQYLTLLGYVSGLLLAFCGLPQAVKSIVEGKTEGISLLFLAMWFGGEIGMLVFSMLKFGAVGPFLINYGFNIAIIAVILYYYFKPRNESL